MTEVPKIVYDRLRAGLPKLGAPERAHPDADLLTAFAEQALQATERDSVLEHLAFCGDCREVVALALPDVGIVAAPVATDSEAVGTTVSRAGAPEPHKLGFAWPSLRWAVLAAGVAAVAAVLLVRPGKLNQFAPSSPNKQIATTAQPASAPSIASSTKQSSVPPSVSADAVSVGPDTAQTKSELIPSKKFKTEHPVPSPQDGSGMLLAYNKKDAAPAYKLPVAPSAKAQAFAYSARPGQGVAESVEVAGASEGGAVTPASEGTEMARNDAPAIEKAKPAPQDTEASEVQQPKPAVGAASARLQKNALSAANLSPSANRTLVHNVTWAINAGILQRSLDTGQSWQSALHADHPLLCYGSHGAEVWTGGQAGTLFHSVDNGITWIQVQPSINAQQLSSDITRIDILGNNIHGNDIRGAASTAGEIVLSTINNEIWTSADSGKTWEKKTLEKK